MHRPNLRLHATGILVGYVLQFLAGMLLNLFVTLPEKHPGDVGSNYFARSWHSLVWSLGGGGGWQLTTHAGIAVILVFGSVALCVKALIWHDKEWAIYGGIAALFTLGAFFNGMSFVDFNKDISSMIMATCWIVAVASVAYGIYITSPVLGPKTAKKKA